MTHQCSHERAPASAHVSAHASVHESAHKSWLSLCYNPIQRLPLECSRECSCGCPRKCTQSGLVVCHLVCFSPALSLTHLGEESSAEQHACKTKLPRKIDYFGTKKVQGEIIYPPPPPFISAHKAFFMGGGWGCIF